MQTNSVYLFYEIIILYQWTTKGAELYVVGNVRLSLNFMLCATNVVRMIYLPLGDCVLACFCYFTLEQLFHLGKYVRTLWEAADARFKLCVMEPSRLQSIPCPCNVEHRQAVQIQVISKVHMDLKRETYTFQKY